MAPRRSWAKADNPYWSEHVAAWYRSALDTEDYCRRRDLSTATLMLWVRHLLSAEDLRKRAEHLQKLRRKEPERQSKNPPPKRRKRPRPNRYSMRTDSGPIALRAFSSARAWCAGSMGAGGLSRRRTPTSATVGGIRAQSRASVRPSRLRHPTS
jgi:hypothetical protein